MPSTLYLPLRSNTGWFTNERTREVLERRIKNALVLYDQLVFQDGRYKLIVLERGQFDFMIPGDAYPGDRHVISYFQSGKPAGIRMRSPETGELVPILEGETVTGYDVDFYPILHEGGLLDVDFVVRSQHDLTQERKNDLKELHQRDSRDEALTAKLGDNTWVNQKVIESAYHDATLSHLIGLPFMADSRVGAFVSAKNGQIGERRIGMGTRQAVMTTFRRLPLRDFGSLGWGRIRSIRESHAGRELRTKIEEITNAILHNPKGIQSQEDVDAFTRQHLFDELLSEVHEGRPSGRRLSLNLGLNLIPYAGFLGSVPDVLNMVRRNRSWISLVDPE